MTKFFQSLATLFPMLVLAGCATPFTEENIDRLRVGMPSSVIRQMFGAPNEISSSVCGGATAGGQWICEKWKYRNSMTDKINEFTFSVKENEKFLNSWSVKR